MINYGFRHQHLGQPMNSYGFDKTMQRLGSAYSRLVIVNKLIVSESGGFDQERLNSKRVHEGICVKNTSEQLPEEFFN